MSKADEIRKRIIELAQDKDGPWELVPSMYSLTIRHTTEHPTPDWARTQRHGQTFALWTGEVYASHVFVSMVGRKVIVGTCAAPWIQRRDQDCPLWLAEMILADPALGLDTERIIQLRAQRREARR